MGNDIFRMKEQSVLDRTLADLTSGNETEQDDKTLVHPEIEDKLLFKCFDFEHFISELVKYFTDAQGKEHKALTMTTAEQLFLTKIDIPHMSSFFNNLLKTYKDKNRQLSECAIKAFIKVIDDQIKERYLCNLTLLHTLAIPFIFCKGRPVDKLQYFHLFFKDETSKQMQITSYTRDLIFSCLCICTYGIRELKIKIREQEELALRAKTNKTRTKTTSNNESANGNESVLGEAEKKEIYDEMKELCDMTALNETLSGIEYDLAGIDINNEEEVPGKKSISWENLYSRYMEKTLKFSIFNPYLLRKYVRENYKKIYNPTGGF